MVPAALVLGIGLVLFTAVKVRRASETGLWALVAASLLASPVAWENYLVLLGPGILLLMALRRWAPALLLIALQTFPSEWRLLWQDTNETVATLALTPQALPILRATLPPRSWSATLIPTNDRSNRRKVAKERRAFSTRPRATHRSLPMPVEL